MEEKKKKHCKRVWIVDCSTFIFKSIDANDMIKKCIYSTSTILEMRNIHNEQHEFSIILNSSLDANIDVFHWIQKMKRSTRMVSSHNRINKRFPFFAFCSIFLELFLTENIWLFLSTLKLNASVSDTCCLCVHGILSDRSNCASFKYVYQKTL